MSDTKVRTRKATALLREDHQKVRKLFSQFEALKKGNNDKKREIFETIKAEVTVHAQIEEELFYPGMQEVQDEEVQELVLEAHEEHKIVKTLLAEVSDLTPENESFDAKMKVLIESVRHHAEEEEQDLFPEFDELPKERQDEISEKLRARKAELSEFET